MNCKKLIYGIFSILFVGIVSMSAVKAGKSGVCIIGGNPNEYSSFEFDEETGILNITGEKTAIGLVKNCDPKCYSWSDWKDKIKKITIEDGIICIGFKVFEGCTSLETIEIPESVKEISWCAFEGCINLKTIKAPESIQKIVKRNQMVDISKLNKVNNMCVFIRHGEKDMNNYCLTAKGKDEAAKYGEFLRLLGKKITVYSSPEDRCIETAKIINDIVNEPGKNVHTSDVLGKPGIQVKNQIEYSKLTGKMKCRDMFNEWKKGLHLDAMNSPEFIKTEIIKFFGKTSTTDGITVYITQSGTIACTGYSLGLVDYNVDNGEWVDFLDGYVYFFNS